jgi:hypothetical protein
MMFHGGVDTKSPAGDGENARQLYKILIDEHVPDAKDVPKQREILGATEDSNKLYVNKEGVQALILETNSSLTATVPDSNDIEVPTVPFGLNLGFKDNWNGSVTFNGYYDANRVNSTSWIPLHDSEVGDYANFLHEGSIQFRARVRSEGHEEPEEFHVTLSFNQPHIVLPKSLACSALSIEPVNANPTYPITIPNYLISNKERCSVRDSDETEYERTAINIGRSFFQAAYIYAQRNASVYIAQANDYDLPSRMERFDAKQILRPPPAPAGYTTPTSAAVMLTRYSSAGILAFCISILFYMNV